MFIRCIFLKGKWHRITVNKMETLLTLIHKIHQTIATKKIIATHIITTRKIIAISKTIDSQVYKVVIPLVIEVMVKMVKEKMVEEMVEKMVKRVIILKSHSIKKVINLKDLMIKKIRRLKLPLTLVRPLLSLYQMIIQTINQRTDLVYMLKMATLKNLKNLIIRRKITRLKKDPIQKHITLILWPTNH